MQYRRLIIAILAIGGASLLALSLVFRQNGWPMNHEMVSFSMRTQLYAHHFLNGDFLPIWSSIDANGYGTPSVFFYHKVFYVLSGSLYLGGLPMKMSIAGTLFLLLLLGGLGMVKLAKHYSDKLVIQITAGLLFILSSYAFVDWLVRGAMAEFSAFMTVPYVLLWVVLLTRKRKFSYWIIPLMTVLYFCHNILAIFSLPILLVAIIHTTVIATAHERRKIIIRSAISLFATIVIFAPYFTFYRVYVYDYQPSVSITEEGYRPQDRMVPLQAYFLKNNLVWLRSTDDFSPYIDAAILLPVLVLMGIVVWNRMIRKHYRMFSTRPELLTYGITLIVYFFLQTEASIPIYSSVRILETLQFPWRLMIFIIPLLIVTLLALIQSFNNYYPKSQRLTSLVGIILVAVMVLSGPIPKQFQYDFISKEVFELPLTDRLMGNSNIGIGEYLPIYKDSNDHETILTEKLTKYMRNDFTSPDVCTTQKRPHIVEPRQIVYDINCNIAVKSFPLPQNFSRLSHAVDQSGKQIHVFRNEHDPRVLVDLPRGHSIITLYQPRWVDGITYLLK